MSRSCLGLRALALAVVIMAPASAPAFAIPFAVNSQADAVDALLNDGVCMTAGGVCTLRAAIQEANAFGGNDTINLPAGNYVITLGAGDDAGAQGDFDITSNVTIVGAGAGVVFVDGNNTDRVFDIHAPSVVVMSGVTVRNANTGNKGGGVRSFGVFTISNCVFDNNTSAEGGAVYADGVGGLLTMNDCLVIGNSANHGGGVRVTNIDVSASITDVTFDNNNAANNGGGLNVEIADASLRDVTFTGNGAVTGAGLFTKSGSTVVDVTNATFSGNVSTGEGGGIWAEGNSLTLDNVTIAGNTASVKGGGIRPKAGTVTITNTIISGNTPDNCERAVTSGGNNIDSGAICGLPAGESNLDPLLGPLQDNGGPTWTRALLTGSPAINKGATLSVALDQRGVARPQGAAWDIGAFELVGIDITGTVNEDVNGDANMGDASARSGVTLHLYLDDGDDTPDGGDTFVMSTTTDGSGNYRFFAAVNATYWIVVDSTTLSPSAGLNGPFAATHAWAEQTYGPAGAWCADGAGGNAERGSAGPCYAGRAPGTSDVAAALTTAQHIARVPVATSNVSGINFAFSFKVVSNTSAATAAAVNVRSAQGSFDQALANANALVGGDTLRFVPALAPNDGGGNWWKVDYTAATAPLESIFDAATVVDGTAYCAWNDGTQGCGATTTTRDTNTAGIGANVAVGVNNTFTTPSLDPELEIVNEGLRVSQATAPLVPHDLEIRNLSIHGDTSFIDVLAGASSLTGMIIEDNVLGSPPDSFTDPLTRPEWGVRISSGTACQVRDNLIGFVTRTTLNLGSATTGCIITRNEVRGSGKTFNTYDGVLLWGLPSTVEGNLIADHEAFGIDTISSGGGHIVRDNTVTLCGLAGVQTGGIRLVGAASVVERNVVSNNTGPGVVVPTAAAQNRISDNQFGGNSGVAIDLVASSLNDNTGDGVTPNDGTQLGTGTAGNACGIVGTSGNTGLDFPIIDSVMLNGDVIGRACANSEIEVYLANAGAGDTSGGTDYGEGVSLLGTATANGSGDFTLNVGGLMPTDELTAIAIDGSNNTSEFSANVTAEPLRLVKRAFQLDGTPIASGSTVPTGMPVKFLIYIDNPGGATLDVRVHDGLDPLFSYQAASIQVDNSYTCVGNPCNAADEAAILAAVEAVTADCHGSGSACTDASDTDIVRYDAAAVPNPEISAGGAGNAQLDIAAGKVWAIVFTIQVQ